MSTRTAGWLAIGLLMGTAIVARIGYEHGRRMGAVVQDRMMTVAESVRAARLVPDTINTRPLPDVEGANVTTKVVVDTSGVADFLAHSRTVLYDASNKTILTVDQQGNCKVFGSVDSVIVALLRAACPYAPPKVSSIRYFPKQKRSKVGR